MKKMIPNGVYPTMITPFTKDNKIDYAAVEALINWYAGKKVDGIFAICQSSEIFFLSFEERLELLHFVMQHTPKNISIVASGHVADDLDTQIEEAKAFIDEGIDAYVFISNRFASADEDDSVFLKNIDRAVESVGDVNFGIYECPYPYKRVMTPAVLKKLAESGRFTFLKDTCCDPGMINEKLRAVDGMGLKIFNANSASLLETLKMGCAGFSGVMANFHPEIYSWLCKNFEKEPEKAKKVQAFLGFASLAECQLYPVNAKYYLSLEGVPMGYNCRSKDASRREIYIVEGDSALGACKLSRDAEFQGIMPVRGKILNCLKADYARIFKSDVITDLMRVLGCGVEVQSKQAKDLSAFNLENLRWNKVIICTDADVDGFQIRTLILTMLYRLAPTLIREGYVYIAESPLYEIVSKGKTYFAYSDREKAAIVDSLGGAKADISRSKGLGENDPEMMWLTTMNPDTRKLIRVMPEDVERTAQMFDLLLGDNLAGRKAHIAECGSQFLDLADIS